MLLFLQVSDLNPDAAYEFNKGRLCSGTCSLLFRSCPVKRVGIIRCLLQRNPAKEPGLVSRSLRGCTREDVSSYRWRYGSPCLLADPMPRCPAAVRTFQVLFPLNGHDGHVTSCWPMRKGLPDAFLDDLWPHRSFFPKFQYLLVLPPNISALDLLSLPA